MSIKECRIVDLPKISDARGNLSFIEGRDHVPFDIARVYYVYDVPAGSERGAHAHKELQQLMIAMSGSFEVMLDDSREKKTFALWHPSEGLYIPPMTWRSLKHFSAGALCCVLASAPYEESDYIRDYPAFLKAVGK